MKRKHLEEAAALLRDRSGGAPDVAIVLGSGLAGAVFGLAGTATTPYKKLPGMPERLASGHAGVAVTGTYGERRVVAFLGRPHLYQGYSPAQVTYPVALAAAAGAHTFVVTNAAGALNTGFRAGDVMLIADQLNFTGTSVSIAKGEPDPFIDMSGAYAPDLRALARHAAQTLGISMQEGTYAGLRGPAYESAAEVRFYRSAGADAVGMSTVLETIAARALKLRVLGLSVITNVWHEGAATNHGEVLAATKQASENVGRLLEHVIATL